MDIKKMLESNWAKLLLPLVILLAVCKIAEGGYWFGVWLFHQLH